MRNSDSKKSIGTVKEIYDLIDSLSPFELQKKWDNSGLNIGSYSSAFKNIYLTLDVTMDIAESIEPDSLIISHHPLIFSPIKSLNFEEYPANITQKLVLKNCSLISAHTNFDATHLNRYFASDILGFKDGVEDDDMIRCKIEKVGFEEFANRIKKILKTETLKATKSSQ